jgi:uncharacterized protein YbjT (DUF2867 family)
MYVIAGVSGHTGSVVANTLLAAKQPVRVIVRDATKGEPWKAKGAEVAVLAIEDQPALTKALAGAQGAYLLLPPPGWSQTGIADYRKRATASILGAVREAKPAHVVLLSSIGAHLQSGTGPIQSLYPVEQGLRDSGVPSTFLRCASFMENWGAMLQGAIGGGALYYGIAEGIAFPQVATEDIGKTAARLLVEGAPKQTRVVELAGPVELTLAQTAEAIAKVSGKPVKAVSVPPAAMTESLVGMGASRELASEYGEMAGAVNSGLLQWGSKDQIRGSITLEQWLRGQLK